MIYLLFLIYFIFLYIGEFLILNNYILSLIFPMILLLILVASNYLIENKFNKIKTNSLKILNLAILIAKEYKKESFDKLSLNDEINKQKIVKEPIGIFVSNLELLKFLSEKISFNVLKDEYNIIKNNKEIDAFLLKIQFQIQEIDKEILNRKENVIKELFRSLITFGFVMFLFLLSIYIFKDKEIDIFNSNLLIFYINIPIILYYFYLFRLTLRKDKYEKEIYK